MDSTRPHRTFFASPGTRRSSSGESSFWRLGSLLFVLTWMACPGSILDTHLATAQGTGRRSQREIPSQATETRPPPPIALRAESSPYLLLHAHNPVDWYPWGLEAFEKAREENKPFSFRLATAVVTGAT